MPTPEQGQGVDGEYGKKNQTGKYSPDACIFAKKNSKNNPLPWWAVDLGDNQGVDSVRITNRDDARKRKGGTGES